MVPGACWSTLTVSAVFVGSARGGAASAWRRAKLYRQPCMPCMWKGGSWSKAAGFDARGRRSVRSTPTLHRTQIVWRRCPGQQQWMRCDAKSPSRRPPHAPARGRRPISHSAVQRLVASMYETTRCGYGVVLLTRIV
ncbi:uncharacterized protein LOC112058495 [Bicyclus anynana]|uniref:Uncharacterized protein LOC112058495 n=1 Tax=Bicyclus anynana TaxID=110368 RepID=A0ABM3LK38_BICAN|nr:uncharacterized protein LOC112058495 [Bicyclus anynana]